MDNVKFIREYLLETINLANNISVQDIDNFIEVLFEAWRKRRTIFIVGNGGSSSTASHFAADLNKTAIVKNMPRFKAICLNDNVPVVSAWTNDEGWDSVYEGQLINLFEENDVLIAFSVHGGRPDWSNNLTKAMEYVGQRQGKVLCMVGFDGGEMKKVADVCIHAEMDSTPQVEGFHSVLTHLITFALKEKITEVMKE